MTTAFIVPNTQEATDGAQEMVREIKNNTLTMDRLPNEYVDYKTIEVANYLSFCSFLVSKNGQFIFSLLEAAEKNG